MDGVIIDVSHSYRETVRETAKLFFKGAQSADALPDPLFSLTDLSRVKQSGGLNNDWDLSCCVIELLFALVKPPKIQPVRDPWHRHRAAMSRCDVRNLAEYMVSQDSPLAALFEDKGNVPNDFVRSFYVGDVGSGNIIKQIFQEIYLGKDLFRTTYGIPPHVYGGDGYLNRETLLMAPSFLKTLYEDNILAIATGRPRKEAEYPLEEFGIRKYFTVIYTHDECLRAEERILENQGKRVSLGKPNPYMLDAIAESLPDKVCKYLYIGDMPDDMIAAKRSRFGYSGIGFVDAATDKSMLKDRLLQAGADFVADDLKELSKVLQIE